MGIHDREYYRDEQQGFHFSSPKSMVIVLIIINVAIFIIDAFSGPTEDGGRNLSSFMALSTDVVQKPWNFYKVITCGFAHTPANIRIWHVVGNMFVLFMLGRSVEDKYGSGEFLRIYLTALIIASVGWLVVQLAQGTAATMYGASGAVSAIVMLFVLNFPHQKLLIWGIVPMPVWLFGVIVVVSDILLAFNPNSHVAWEAHMAGLAFGAAYFYFNWNLHWMDVQWIRNLTSRAKTSYKRRHLKIHRPPGEDPQLKAEADRILEKMHNEGEASLTKKERKTLEKYSKMLRQRKSS
jgi:membrane associated rhomboid family serine protease